MKKTIYYWLLAFAVFSFAACSSDEDTTPSLADVNAFAPGDDDGSTLANIRREFYKATGSYLLFNDTLSVKDGGVDSYGNPIKKVQTVDLDYYFVSDNASSYVYTFDYIEDEGECSKAAKLLEQKLMNRLGALSPFSVLLVEGIYQWQYDDNGELEPTEEDDYYGTNPNPLFYLGPRCYAISLEHGEAFDDPDFFDNVFVQILIARIKSVGGDEYKKFKAAVENYDDLTDSWNYKDDLGYDLGEDDDLARSLGFLRDNNKWQFPDASMDLTDYVNAVVSYSLEDFEAEYADYPICIDRFKILRNLIIGCGVKLDK